MIYKRNGQYMTVSTFVRMAVFYRCALQHWRLCDGVSVWRAKYPGGVRHRGHQIGVQPSDGA